MARFPARFGTFGSSSILRLLHSLPFPLSFCFTQEPTTLKGCGSLPPTLLMTDFFEQSIRNAIAISTASYRNSHHHDYDFTIPIRRTCMSMQEQVEVEVLRNEITRLRNENAHINSVADVKEDALESLYEKRSRKKSLATENIQHEIDTGPNKLANAQNEDETVGENDDIARDNGFVKLTKAEKGAKLKNLRKEAKKQGTPVTELEEVQHSSQAEVLEKKKFKLAELGTTLTDPEENIESLKEMLQICKDGNQEISVLGGSGRGSYGGATFLAPASCVKVT
ncbi:hypothetical protein L2E82_42400 [Cichorium intybus]|uniref:Uncharacterized protein n=1 Tax=Cichorium intybus TaxID=13427 RepID=A0ACB8ZLV4_CICIN|nr:hypothetical protein L2E82_42400 [Cichorium intybus]